MGRPVGLLQLPDGVAARVGRRRQPRMAGGLTERARSNQLTTPIASPPVRQKKHSVPNASAPKKHINR